MVDAESFLQWGRTPDERARLANERMADHPRAKELHWIALANGDLKLVTRPGWYAAYKAEQERSTEEQRKRFNWRRKLK